MSDNNEENEEMVENEEEEEEIENNENNEKEETKNNQNEENDNNNNNNEEEEENEEIEEEEENNENNNQKEENIEDNNNNKNENETENKQKKKANIIVKNTDLQKKIKSLEKDKKKEPKKELLIDEKIEKIKEINNKKFQNISSQYLNTNSAINTFLIPETKELHSNPEYIKDFNQAKDEILNKLSENEKNEDIMKILFPSGFEKKPSKKTLISSERISEKISDALAKKKDEIERIKKQYDNEYQSKHTFSPKINNDDKKKRKLNEFLEDQKSHQQQVKDKISNLKNKKDEEIKKNISNKPKINKNTDELVKKKNKGENLEPVHLRLYNLKDEKQKKIIEGKEKKEKEIKENREQKKKNFLPKYLQKNNNNNNENKNKEKKEIKKNFFKKKYLLEKKDLNTNKFILNNFDEKFNEILNKFFQDENDNNNNNNNENDNNEENKNKKNEDVQNYDNKTISQSQLEELLFKMGMTTISPTKKEKKEEDEEQQQKLSSNESVIKQEEKRLLSEIYENLKEDDNNIKISNLKKFLYCIVGLYNYILFKEFCNANPNEFKNIINNNNNNENEDNYDEIIIKQNEEIENNIDKNNNNNNKYISYDQNKNIIYTLKNSKNIKKDFNLFSINFSQNRIKKNPSSIPNNEKNLFIPNINKNSEQMSQKFREKIFNNNPDIIDSNSNPINNTEKNNNEKMNYINKILMQRKKRLAENEKIREENLKKEMEQCTFKPKINNVASVVLKPRGANRIEELYHKGSEKEKKRKNKTSDEVDFDKNQKEYTFHPNIDNIPIDNNNINFKNDIHGDRSYRLYYERIRNGRMEQLVKDAINDRYELDEVLKDFIKKNKKEIEEENLDDNNNFYDEMNIETSERENNNNNNNGINKENENEDDEIDKKEGIPQLIIDVNIRQGVKKKIYVYEGDTPENLAEKFAKEHNLEPETKEKLQNLIRNHMLRLLTKIDEENQSLSEK